MDKYWITLIIHPVEGTVEHPQASALYNNVAGVTYKEVTEHTQSD